MLSHEFFPLILAVLQEPLVACGNDALVSRSRDDLLLWLVVWHCQSLLHQVLLYLGLCSLHLLALGHANDHPSLVESLLVRLVLGLLQELFVVLRFDTELLNQGHSCQLSEIWNFDDFNGGKRSAPLFLDTKLLPQFCLRLKISESGPVVGSIRWYRSDNTSTLGHRDCFHG